MSLAAPSDLPAGRVPAPYLIPLSLLLILGLFPPETRGESMAGCAVLIALAAVIGSRGGWSVARGLPLLVLAACAVPLVLGAHAPGAAVEPLALAFLAAAAGVYGARLAVGVKAELALPLTVAIVGGLVAVQAVVQQMWGLDRLALRLEHEPALPAVMLERVRGGRAFASFPTPAALGGFLALVLPVTVAGALGRRDRWKWPLLASAAAQIGGLLAAASATALGALLGAVALTAWGWKAARPRVAAAVGILVLLLAGVVALRGRSLIDPTDPESPWRLRAGNFRVAGNMIAEHPWLGVGPGGFGEAYPRYRQAGDNESQHAHNLPLELCAELGLASGLVVSVLFYGLFLGPVVGTQGGRFDWRRGAAVGLAAFALQNLADFTAFLPSVLWSACLLRGLLARPDPAPPGVPERLMGRPVLCGTIVAALVCVLSGLGANQRVRSWEASLRGAHQEAAAAAQRATRKAPWNVDGWLLRTQTTLAVEGDPERREHALAQVGRAVALSPVRPFARHLRGRLRLALGDAPGGYADERMAAELYPGKEEYSRAREEVRQRIVDSGLVDRGR